MLFNSYAFIFGFLPVVLAGAALLQNHLVARRLWAVSASMVFHGWWSWKQLMVLLVSMAANFILGRLLEQRRTKAMLVLGIAGNLSLLGLFKYTDFILANVTPLLGIHVRPLGLPLPLGISFYSFTQIAYLVDVYRGRKTGVSLLDYSLFVLVFPHLIAGPIVHHGQLIPQFQAAGLRVTSQGLAVGSTWFAFGLFKKTCLADPLSEYPRLVAKQLALGDTPTFLEAWTSAWAYAAQLYFDFSGYSDMAIGLGWMLGLLLPLNFAAPYRSQSIIDFWRRWHLTLSAFLRDYLYFSLGGNRLGPWRRHLNLLLTMFLGGLWHGAGWTFVLWGTLHGAALVLTHAVAELRTRFVWPASQAPAARVMRQALTFVTVTLLWVPFRAVSLDATWTLWTQMFMPDSVEHGLTVLAMGAVLLTLFLCWPASHEVLQARGAAADHPRLGDVPPRFSWVANRPWAAVTAVCLAAGVLRLGEVTVFIYYNF